MLHIFLAFYLLCFSLDVVVVAFSLLAYSRTGATVFLYLVFIFCAIELLLLGNIFRLYETATPDHVFGPFLPGLTFAIEVAGCGLLVYSVVRIAYEIVELPLGVGHVVVQICLVALAVAAGGVKELLGGVLFSSVLEIVMAGSFVYAIVIVIVRFDRIAHPRFRSLVQAIMLVVAIMLAATAAVMILEAEIPSLRRFPSVSAVHIVFFLAIIVLLFLYAARYLFQPGTLPTYQLPEEIVERFGISPREREIISMIVQGYPNRAIGEKLFISSTTVKNHIYHIYQKTGAANKIQLINLMNSPK